MMFMLSGDEDTYLKQSAIYFNNALEDGTMESSADEKVRGNARLARSMATIGEYIGSKGRNSASAVLEDEVTFLTLWEDLQLLYQETPLDTVSNAAIGTTLYSRIANIVYENYQDFAGSGITLEQMETFITQIEEALKNKENNMGGATMDPKYKEYFTNAYANIETAKIGLKGAAKKGGN
jgi:hypothetical protein